MINKLASKFQELKIYLKYGAKVKVLGMVDIQATHIIWGRNVKLYSGVQISGNGKIILGDNVAIGKDTIIFSGESVTIEANTLIAAQCYIIDSDHGISRDRRIQEQKMINKPIVIEEDCWLGAGVKVLKGSTIKEGSVVGAGCIVNGATEPYSINVGVPFRKIGERK
ncbi:acyltransferase [Paenibacillus koleovorans]|uniref:acyltransferase n=1 Tax=Paenibacillus koleovorans TaxID=121608 RepID=UPI000FDBE706|nr:acyltransferase [Paenibacillus koleovorans]